MKQQTNDLKVLSFQEQFTQGQEKIDSSSSFQAGNFCQDLQNLKSNSWLQQCTGHHLPNIYVCKDHFLLFCQRCSFETHKNCENLVTLQLLYSQQEQRQNQLPSNSPILSQDSEEASLCLAILQRQMINVKKKVQQSCLELQKQIQIIGQFISQNQTKSLKQQMLQYLKQKQKLEKQTQIAQRSNNCFEIQKEQNGQIYLYTQSTGIEVQDKITHLSIPNEISNEDIFGDIFQNLVKDKQFPANLKEEKDNLEIEQLKDENKKLRIEWEKNQVASQILIQKNKNSDIQISQIQFANQQLGEELKQRTLKFQAQFQELSIEIKQMQVDSQRLKIENENLIKVNKQKEETIRKLQLQIQQVQEDLKNESQEFKNFKDNPYNQSQIKRRKTNLQNELSTYQVIKFGSQNLLKFNFQTQSQQYLDLSIQPIKDNFTYSYQINDSQLILAGGFDSDQNGLLKISNCQEVQHFSLIHPRKYTTIVYDNLQTVFIIAGRSLDQNNVMTNKCEMFNISNHKQDEISNHIFSSGLSGMSYAHSLIFTFGGSFGNCTNKICFYDMFNNS